MARRFRRWPHFSSRWYCEAFLTLALWQFVWLFPSEPKPRWARTIGKSFLVAASAIGVTLFLSNAVLGLTSFSSTSAWASTLLMLDRMTTTLLFWPVLFAVAAPAIPYLIWKSRVETATNRRKIAWFVASLGIALSPVLTAVLLTPFFPALTSPLWRARVGAIVYIALASMVPTTAYAVAVSQVLDLHLVIRRTLQYGLAKTSVWCAILLPLLYLVFDIYNNRSLRVEEYLTVRRPFEPLLLSLVSFGILTFRHQILQHVDRWFSRDASDHTESLARLEQGLRSARTIRDISGTLKREIERALHPSSVAVLMVDPSEKRLVSLESPVPPLGMDPRCSISFDRFERKSKSAIAQTVRLPDCSRLPIARGSRTPDSGSFHRCSARRASCWESLGSVRTRTAWPIRKKTGC